MSACKNCGSTEADEDSARGDKVCTNCGNVLEEQIIVSDVQFQENSAGGSSVLGMFVGEDGKYSCSGFRQRISSEVTKHNARNRIQKLASSLNLKSHHVDKAMRFFDIANVQNFTKGRKSNHVAAACLYIVCRLDPTYHMLLDFSDVLQVDVYTLGHAYLQLCTKLKINLPYLDPSIYIDRFAHKLEFGEKCLEVAKLATRLVARMKRDWMVQGRRPSGICGAALLVAARTKNFNRSIKDIMKVVRIGEGTIKKRLLEFEQTPSSELTVEQFEKIDLEEEMDPPSYIEGKKKAKIAEHNENGDLTELMEEVENLQPEIESAISEMCEKKNRRYKKFKVSDDGDNVSLCSMAPSLSELDEELAHYKNLLHGDDVLKPLTEEDEEGKDLETTSQIILTKYEKENIKLSDERDPEVENLESAELESILMASQMGPRPTAASLGLKESIEDCLKSSNCCKEDSTPDSDGELDLSGIDDDEIDEYLLNDDDVKIKTTIWMRENADFLKVLKEKEERKARELLENPEPKKKRKPRKRQIKTEASTAREAIEKMLQDKKISNKINYDVLMGLNLGPMKPASDEVAIPEFKKPKLEEVKAEKLNRSNVVDSSQCQILSDTEPDDHDFYYEKDDEPELERSVEYEEPVEEYDDYYESD